MIRRILEMIKGSIAADRRGEELKELIKVQQDPGKKVLLEAEYENLGFMRIVICKDCFNYRSDLEWRGKKNETKQEAKLRQERANCRRCGSNKVGYPPKVPLRVILRLTLRFVIKGY